MQLKNIILRLPCYLRLPPTDLPPPQLIIPYIHSSPWLRYWIPTGRSPPSTCRLGPPFSQESRPKVQGVRGALETRHAESLLQPPGLHWGVFSGLGNKFWTPQFGSCASWYGAPSRQTQGSLTTTQGATNHIWALGGYPNPDRLCRALSRSGSLLSACVW
jgi:hypothetical protein